MISLRKKQCVRVTVLVVLCLFSFESFSTPALLEVQHAGNMNLQVQSVFFAPILQEIGWEHRAQIRAELDFILAMVQTVREGVYVNSFDINSELDKWIGQVPGSRRRFLEVICGPYVLGSGTSGEGSVEALIGFKDHAADVIYKLTAEFKNDEKITLDGEGVTLKAQPISRAPDSFRENGELTGTAGKLESIERPLDRIPQSDARNILIFSDFDKMEPKVGEVTIDLWPLVSSLRVKYPNSIIYVATAFPDVYFTEQFKGKVRPLPRTLVDIAQWGYKLDEWEHCRLELMTSPRYDPSNKAGEVRKRFVVDRKIDMIFNVSSAPEYFGGIDFENMDGHKRPHLFAVSSATSSASAMDARTAKVPPVPEYTDRSGKKFKVAGFSDMLKKVAPSGNFVAAGIWELSMGTCRTLGLDVSKENLGTVTLGVKESLGAMALLKKWYSEGGAETGRPAFDPSKKIIVVNVYALTQGNLIDHETWITLIRVLTENVHDAYFVFTRGGPYDRGTEYVENIVRELGKNNSNIIIPRVDIYPYINDLLGIASGLVTLDTGLGHLGNGVYNIPTAVITKNSILHWLTPRDNIFPLFVFQSPGQAKKMLYDMQQNFGKFDAEQSLKFRKYLFDNLVEGMVSYSKVINCISERPVAKVAKVAAAQSHERVRLDEELVRQRIELPDAQRGLEEYLKGLIVLLDLEEYFAPEAGGLSHHEMSGFPEIVFVDSSKQTGVGLPRFGTKLYASNDGKTYLLVDVSVVENFLDDDGKTAKSVRRDVMRFDAIHEIFGHVLARNLFPEFIEARKKLRKTPDNGAMLDKEVEEEVLAWLMTVFTAQKLIKTDPTYADDRILDGVNSLGIKITQESVDFDVRTILYNLESTGKFESLSTFRYIERLIMKPILGAKIESEIRARYLDRVKKVFEDKIKSPTGVGKHISPASSSTSGGEAGTAVRDPSGDDHALDVEKLGEEDRVIDVIKDMHRENKGIVGRKQNIDGVREIIQNMGTSPVEIIVDLSLIPENDIDENMKSWACLVLSCIDMPNVSFVFERRPEMIEAVSLPENIEKIFAKVPESSIFLDILRKEVRSSAESEAEVEKFLNERVRDTRLVRAEGEEDPIEVLITSKEFLSWVSSPSSGVTLKPNQYPVALDGEGIMSDGKTALRNFEAAVSLALSRAALVMAKRRVDKGENGAEELYEKLKEQLLPGINRLYAVIFGEDINLTKKTLDNMVYTGGKDEGATVRINLAIKLALPSITYMEIEKLREMHMTVRIYLQSA